MTDEMTIQQQSPSALPYVGIGGAVGAAGGYGLSRVDAVKKRITEPAKYTSFEDLIRESDDKFTKALNEAEGNEKELMEKAKDARTAANNAKKDYTTKWREFVENGQKEGKNYRELTTEYIKNNGSRKDAVNKALAEYKKPTKGLYEKINNKKLAVVIAGAAALGALIGLAIKPSSKEA